MKNLIGFGLVMIVTWGCQKKDDMPVMNQLSFTMGGEMFDCYDRFYWDRVYNFSVHFQSEALGMREITIKASHFTEVGEYIIDSFNPSLSDVITISGEAGSVTYSTFPYYLSPCFGSGRITIDKVTDRFIKGRFEGILIGKNCQDTIEVVEGAFQISRD